MEKSKNKVEQKAITKVRNLIDDIEYFTYSFKEMDKNISWDGTIEMYNGNIDKKENYDYLSKHIKTIVSDDIYSGIKIVYKDKVYDFSLSERNA